MLRSTAPWRLIDHLGATRFAILSTLCLGIGLASAPAQAGPKVGLFHGATSGPAAEIKQKLDATMAFDKVDLIDGTRIDPNIATTLKQYQALVLFNNNGNAWADLANSGNAVAQFIDDGGGVVVYNPYITYNSPSYGPQGNFVSKYLLSDPATASSFFPR